MHAGPSQPLLGRWLLAVGGVGFPGALQELGQPQRNAGKPRWICYAFGALMDVLDEAKRICATRDFPLTCRGGLIDSGGCRYADSSNDNVESTTKTLFVLSKVAPLFREGEREKN